MHPVHDSLLAQIKVHVPQNLSHASLGQARAIRQEMSMNPLLFTTEDLHKRIQPEIVERPIIL
jgi:hypothetical protein